MAGRRREASRSPQLGSGAQGSGRAGDTFFYMKANPAAEKPFPPRHYPGRRPTRAPGHLSHHFKEQTHLSRPLSSLSSLKAWVSFIRFIGDLSLHVCWTSDASHQSDEATVLFSVPLSLLKAGSGRDRPGLRERGCFTPDAAARSSRELGDPQTLSPQGALNTLLWEGRCPFRPQQSPAAPGAS